MTSGAHNSVPPPGFSPTSSHPSESPPEHPAERKKDSNKRRRNPLSCAECRRLKLRCDRVFPCESCRKRGCAAICPEGALTTKGTRFVLANTEELHDKIIDMSDRIRQLEEALAASNHLPERHPLLREDLLLIKVPVEFRNESAEEKVLKKLSSVENIRDESVPAMVTAFGTLKLGSDGYSRFFGQTARTEHFLQDDKEAVRLEIARSKIKLPPEILQVSQAFPFGSVPENNELTKCILTFLPPYHEAWRFVQTYFAHTASMYMPIQRQSFVEDVFKHVYDHIQAPETMKKHRLALVFAVLAHGVLSDITREAYSPLSDQFQLLSRASLAMTALMAEPSIYAIQALHLLALHTVLSNKPDGGPVGWVIQSLNVKLAVALGLHRDLEYWGGSETDKEQLEVRRWVFWEIMTLDAWLSLGLGRPPTLHLPHVDCKFPAATQRALAASDGTLQTWHTWKHRHAVFINRVLQKALDTKTPPYSEILDLDREIHRYTMAPDAEALVKGQPVPPPSPERTPGLTLERAFFLTAKYTPLLLLHRGFFAQALSEGNDPMQSKYAPSVMATYRSACYMILALHHLYERHPELACRFGLHWSNAFTGSISLCLLVTRATKSSYAPLALDHLNLAYELFRKAAPDCYPANKVLPMATKLYEKAHAAFAPYGDGHHPASLAPRRSVDNDDEELSVLGGKTNVVSDKPSSVSKSRLAPQSPPIHPASPGVPMPQTSHLDSVHPSLVQYVSESPWASDMAAEEQLSQQYVQVSMTPASAQHFAPAAQHHASYSPQDQQQHHYVDNANISQQGYHAYSTYPAGSNVHPASLSADGRYTYYDNTYPSEGLVGPGRPEIQQPQPQNQYATWQTYVQQLYN